MRGTVGRRFRLSVVVALGLAAVSGGVSRAEDAVPWLGGSVGSEFLVRIRDARTASTVRRGLGQAVRFLDDASCRGVFTDFSDSRGHTLQSRLDRHGVSAQDYLRLVVFLDGSEAAQCRSHAVVAFTSVGSRAVFVCGDSFQAMSRARPELGGVLLIHEVLHSLGLEENPPTTHQITDHVMQRCGPRTLMAAR